MLLVEQYKGTIAAIIMSILRETKETSQISVPFEDLKECYTAESVEDVQLDDLIEYIGSASGEAISIQRHGNKKVVKVLDKTALWLMLYSLDADLADVSLLHWSDFEKLVQHAMVENGYATKKNYRFVDGKGKRHEIDIVAIDKRSRDHLVFLIDAKNWDYRANSSTARILEAANDQYNRCVALGETLPVLSDLLFEMKLQWQKCIIIPMVVTLLAPPVRDFFIPIVSILQFNGFMQEFTSNMDMYKKKYVSGIPVQKQLL
ncbi:MAG: restriction endonuclease [Candidatus Sigynarchaeota archaeon]